MAINVKPQTLLLNRGNSIAQNLVFVYGFTENAGTKLLDSANHQDMTTTGAPTWKNDLLGPAMVFNGSSQYASNVDSPLIDTLKQITVSMWFRKTADTNGYSMYASRATGTSGSFGDAWLLYNTDAGPGHVYAWAINTGSATYLNTSTNSNSDKNTFINLTGTYDGANMKIYRNGIEIGTAAKTGDLTAEANPIIIAGGQNGSSVSEFAPINVSSVVISRRGWTPTEVRSYYQNPWQIYKQPKFPVLDAPAPPASTYVNSFYGTGGYF